MFHRPTPSMAHTPNRKKLHQHHESKTWTRLLANEKCLVCYPVPKSFLETSIGKVPPEVRETIYTYVLTVGSLSPLKDDLSVPMTKTKYGSSQSGSKSKLIGPEKASSCLDLIQTCRQIYHESSLLFYAINTVYLSNPEDMLSFLRHLGPVRCSALRSLHLGDIMIQAPVFSQRDLNAWRQEVMHPDAKKAIQLLNKRGNIWKIYLDARPSEALAYIKLCTQVPGLEHSEVAFTSPTRWSVMVPSTTWGPRSWFRTFVEGLIGKPLDEVPYLAYWGGDGRYRVEVDIISALPKARFASMGYDRSGNDEIQGSSSVDMAMDGLSLS